MKPMISTRASTQTPSKPPLPPVDRPAQATRRVHEAYEFHAHLNNTGPLEPPLPTVVVLPPRGLLSLPRLADLARRPHCREPAEPEQLPNFKRQLGKVDRGQVDLDVVVVICAQAREAQSARGKSTEMSQVKSQESDSDTLSRGYSQTTTMNGRYAQTRAEM